GSRARAGRAMCGWSSPGSTSGASPPRSARRTCGCRCAPPGRGEGRARPPPDSEDGVSGILDLASYDAVQSGFSWPEVWKLFDGTAERMNIAHECIDRHRARGPAISVEFADGHAEHYAFGELADLTGRFAHWLDRRGVAKGDRVAVILDPSRAFYVGVFGAMKHGAIAVPLFTLFGPEGLALRIDDC